MKDLIGKIIFLNCIIMWNKIKNKVFVLNLTTRSWMLHYSSQFCNELIKYVDLKVAIASYYNQDLYNNKINFIKIKSTPKILNFIIETITFWNHLIFLYKIIKFKPEIVHFIDNHPWYIFYARIFKLLWYKIYTTQHDPTLHSWENVTLLAKISIKVNKKLRKLSDKLFVHWNILKKELILKYWINEKKVVSIVHGNYNFFKDIFSKWWKPNKNNFLFFWRIVDYKWLDLLLESLFLIKKQFSDFKLIIAWPWDLWKYINNINKLENNIEIYNYNIEPEEAYNFFEKSEFVILPYYDATWSWIIPLSYAFSKAVIVTNVWELSSIVENNTTWKIIKWNDIKKLADTIIYMLKNKKEVINMWKNWREYSEKKLWWEWIIKKIYWF